MHRSDRGNDETGGLAAYGRARDLHDGPSRAVRVSDSDSDYAHIPPKPAGSVSVVYHQTGKMLPRTLASVPQDKPAPTAADFACGIATMMGMISDSHPR